MITTPADERLVVEPTSWRQVVRGTVPIRAKVWGGARITNAWFRVDEGEFLPMRPLRGSALWEAEWASETVPDGIHTIEVVARDAARTSASDKIRVVVRQSGAYTPPARAKRDQDNTIGAWLERGIVGTQLGPNKNGRKW